MKKWHLLKIEIGKKYGMLKVLCEGERLFLPSGQTNRTAICLCDCGNIKQVRLLHLTRHRTISCGCLHGESHPQGTGKLYSVWRQMMERCHKPYTIERNKRRYQDKGIGVCDKWRKSFNAFYDWAMKNGYKEGLQIDRKDNSKGYDEYNCRWVTHLINVNNRDMTIRIVHNGELKSARLVLTEAGIPRKRQSLIIKRIQRGWEFDEAIKYPPLSKRDKKKRLPQGFDLNNHNQKLLNNV